eukprot:SAG11_NODE_9954_length_866_cov_1.856584_2_plen_35_part_01
MRQLPRPCPFGAPQERMAVGRMEFEPLPDPQAVVA